MTITEPRGKRERLRTGSEGPRVVRIRNSAHVDEILVFEDLVPEVEAHPKMSLLAAPRELEFDATGNLF